MTMAKCGKSLYSIYRGINDAIRETNAVKNGWDYECENTPTNREILSRYRFPKHFKNGNTILF